MSRAQTPHQRRLAAAEAAQKMRKEQQATARRRRVLGWSVVGVAVVALIAVTAVVLIQHVRKTSYDDIALAEVDAVPTVALPEGGIPVSAAGVGELDESVPQVDLYQDFMCPGCGSFEKLNAQMLDELVAQGLATVVYHPLATLDAYSANTQYSTRAASAAALVAEEDSDHYVAFTESMFSGQPEENTTGLTNVEIADIARGVGVPDSVADQIKDDTAWETYGQWVYSSTQLAVSKPELIRSDKTSLVTPTVVIDGVLWEGAYDTDTLQAAILGED